MNVLYFKFLKDINRLDWVGLYYCVTSGILVNLYTSKLYLSLVTEIQAPNLVYVSLKFSADFKILTENIRGNDSDQVGFTTAKCLILWC